MQIEPIKPVKPVQEVLPTTISKPVVKKIKPKPTYKPKSVVTAPIQSNKPKDTLLSSFQKWLALYGYSKNTVRQYGLAELRLISRYEGEITQETINGFLISLNDNQNGKKSDNPFYRGFIKAYVDYCNETKNTSLHLVKRRGKGLSGDGDDKKKSIKFIERQEVDTMLDQLKEDSQLYLMIRLLFETGLRAFELFNIRIDGKNWGWNLDTRFIWGIGKGNKRFEVKISKKTANLMELWLTKCNNPDQPFLLYKSGGDPYKSSYEKFYRILKDSFGITPHQLRHALGHHLRVDKNFDIEQIRKVLRHSDIKTTQIYVVATKEEVYDKMDREIFDND